MLNKRGQGLSTNAIVLIVLAVVVLIILIAGFTMGWTKIMPFLSSENVDTIVSSCETACSTNSIYGYCTKLRTLNDGTNKVEDTCKNFANYAINTNYKNYGVQPCSITCPTEETSTP